MKEAELFWKSRLNFAPAVPSPPPVGVPSPPPAKNCTAWNESPAPASAASPCAPAPELAARVTAGTNAARRGKYRALRIRWRRGGH